MYSKQGKFFHSLFCLSSSHFFLLYIFFLSLFFSLVFSLGLEKKGGEYERGETKPKKYKNLSRGKIYEF